MTSRDSQTPTRLTIRPGTWGRGTFPPLSSMPISSLSVPSPWPMGYNASLSIKGLGEGLQSRQLRVELSVLNTFSHRWPMFMGIRWLTDSTLQILGCVKEASALLHPWGVCRQACTSLGKSTHHTVRWVNQKCHSQGFLKKFKYCTG